MDPLGPRALFRFAAPIRVRFSDTDAQGVVHHATFFIFAEVARHEYWARVGVSRFVMAREGLDDTVVEVQSRYHRPAHFYDLLNVRVRTAVLGRTSCAVEFLVTRGGAEEVIAELRSVHVIVDLKSRRPIPIPAFFRQAVLDFEGPNVHLKYVVEGQRPDG